VNKGILLMIIAGIGFMYLVTDLVSEAESTTPGLENSQSRKAREYAKYYSVDINGDDVLNLSGIPLPKAKSVWKESMIREKLLGYFPDFDIMKQVAKDQLQDSAFKTYFLKKLWEIEGKYIDGGIGLDQARSAIESL
jgi:hypothetical protein